MNFSNEVVALANQLKKSGQLSMFESLKLALDAERNEILKKGLNVSGSNIINGIGKLTHTIQKK